MVNCEPHVRMIRKNERLPHRLAVLQDYQPSGAPCAPTPTENTVSKISGRKFEDVELDTAGCAGSADWLCIHVIHEVERGRTCQSDSTSSTRSNEWPRR